jgi:hypothetical protein
VENLSHTQSWFLRTSIVTSITTNSPQKHHKKTPTF